MLKLKEKKERNRLRFFTYSVYGTLLGLFFIFLFIIFGKLAVNNFDVNKLFIFDSRPTLIVTGSMEPAIKVNGLVVLEPVEFNEIEVGDIIRYTSYEGYSVLHRVIFKNSSYVVTKGDNNPVQDQFAVTADRITGRVKSIHNETAEPLTKLFGRIDMKDYTTYMRFGLGFLILGVLICLGIVLFIVIFEMITTVYFFKKYNRGLIISSNYWVDKINSKDEEVEIIGDILKEYDKVNWFKKIIISFKLRRYYNGLCNIEKEVNKTEKRLNSINKSIKKHK